MAKALVSHRFGPPQPTPPDRLDSWKEIASYLNRIVRTVARWEREQGLPVHREKTGAVYAYKSELDAWWRGGRVRLEAPAPAPRSRWRYWVAGIAAVKHAKALTS